MWIQKSSNKRQTKKQEMTCRFWENNACKHDSTGKHRKHKRETDEPTKSEQRLTNETQVNTEKEGEKQTEEGSGKGNQSN